MKERFSKLDAHADRLNEWLLPEHEGGRGMTLAQAREQLRQDGCAVSVSRLGEWWSDRCTRQREAALLASITTGRRMREDVEKELEQSGAPGMETLIKLLRVLTLNLSAKANIEPELFEPLTFLLKNLLDWEKEEGKKEDRRLAREKFEFDAARACLKQLPTLKAISTDKSLNDDQRIEQIRLKLFGEVPAEG